jgi:hypothetical protein
MPKLVSTLMLCMLVAAAPAHAQTAASKNPTSVGTVVTVTRTTLLIRTGPEDYRLFVLDNNTTRPAKLPWGALVSVAFRASENADAPFATLVRVTAPPPGSTAPVEPEQEVVPTSVRNLEQSVKRQAQRFRVGARTGATLDEELFSLGGHVQVGPFFGDRIWARPNVELGFGEITTLVGLNFEGIYRMPVTQSDGRFAVYFGGGPGLNFIDRGAEALDPTLDDSRFDNFDLDVGFNILMGCRCATDSSSR